MGKRSTFERAPRDFYPTPREAVLPLLPHLNPGTRFVEPCAGNGELIGHLFSAGHQCVGASDIEPSEGIRFADATTVRCDDNESCWAEFFITNPPWVRAILHPIIVNLSDQLPTWLLFDADWIHTRQSAAFMSRLRKVVSVGRVKWIPDSKMTGKDNCAWHLFGKPSSRPAELYGRLAA